MGETAVKIRVYNLKTLKSKECEILVDTGATYTSLPKDLLEDLGVERVDKVLLKLADGRIVERGLGNVLIEIEGRMRANPVLFGEREDSVIMSLVTLESCGLTVDTVNKKLVPLPEIHHY